LNIYDWDFKDIFKELGINCNGEITDLKAIMLNDLQALQDALEKKKNMLLTTNSFRREEIENNIQHCEIRLESEVLSDEEVSKIQEQIENANAQLKKLATEVEDIKKHTEVQNKKILEIKSEINNIKTQEEALRKCVVTRRIYLSAQNNNRLTDSEKELLVKRENRIKYSVIASFLSKIPSYTDYILDREIVMRNVDYVKRDLSAYANAKSSQIDGKQQPYSYGIKFTTRPEELYVNETLGKDVHIYSFGNIQYQSIPSDDGVYHKKGVPYNLIGVTRKDEQGNMQTYHGFIYTLANVDPEFYINVVFSNLVMRNAEKNNFGYIGKIDKLEEVNPDINDYNYRLTFDEIDIEDTIKAASFAMTNEGNTNIPAIRTLSDIYEYMDRMMVNMLNKSTKNTEDKYYNKVK
jgi:hypothetical protein